MKRTSKIFSLYVAVFLLSSSYASAQFEGQMKAVCPKAWESTTVAVPHVWPTTDIWKSAAEKNAAKPHIKESNLVATIDKATDNKLLADPLTVASECLKYRNFIVDTSNAGSTPAVPVNQVTGWIPAAIL